MKRRRLLQTILLLLGLAAIAVTIAETVHDAKGRVMPSTGALVIAGLFCVAAIVASARAWAGLFSDLLVERANRVLLRGTFYLSQLTKYLPAGGAVQAASQLGLAPTAGVPLKRAAVAFPVSIVGAVAGGATIGAGLVFATDLPGWVRVLSLLGLSSVILLHRGLLARVLDLSRRVIHRIPTADQLPRQRDILLFYGWALITIGSLCAAYTVLLGSLVSDQHPFQVFCAFAVSWVIGFLAIPIPAGVGVREALLVGLLPGVGTAPLLAASLALRLLSIGSELLALLGNKLVARRYTTVAAPDSHPELVQP
jgi:uncharacterized membrane protein YbhN (UPF0104 family)